MITTKATFQVMKVEAEGKEMWFWRANMEKEWFRLNNDAKYQQRRQEQRANWVASAAASQRNQRTTTPPESHPRPDAWATWKAQQPAKAPWKWAQ